LTVHIADPSIGSGSM